MANTEYRTVNPLWLTDHTLHLCMHAALTVNTCSWLILRLLLDVNENTRVKRGGGGGEGDLKLKRKKYEKMSLLEKKNVA